MELTLLPHDHGDARRAALLRRQLLLGGDFGAAAELFRLLDDSSRLRIFWLLCHMEECVVNISAVTGMSSPAVSHHLRLLKDAGLVRSRREGKEVRYRAAETPTCRLLHEMIEKTMEISCPQLGEEEGEGALSAFSAEQVETVRRMHDELLQHPERRVPIEELARRYLPHDAQGRVQGGLRRFAGRAHEGAPAREGRRAPAEIRRQRRGDRLRRGLRQPQPLLRCLPRALPPAADRVPEAAARRIEKQGGPVWVRPVVSGGLRHSVPSPRKIFAMGESEETTSVLLPEASAFSAMSSARMNS